MVQCVLVDLARLVCHAHSIYLCGVHVRHVFMKFLHHLNSIRLSIQFTMEKKEEGRLPFLDVLVCHNREEHSGLPQANTHRLVLTLLFILPSCSNT